ncbi:MAG: mucoidy inhibitor MuiA family protein [Hyphomicrobiales bacterium]
MRSVLLAAALATTFLTPVSAAELTPDSRIDAVTVYPQGAEVTRVANTDLDRGDHTLVLDNLPGDVDPQSIRVEGAASGEIEIASVDSKRVHVVDDAGVATERKRIERQIEGLQDERAALDQLVEDATYQRKLLQDLASKPFAIQGKSEDAPRVDSTEFGNMFDLVATKLGALSKTVLDANVRKREIDKQVQELHQAIAELAPKQRVKTVVTVHLASNQETRGQFKVRYRIANAGWVPFYEARLESTFAKADPTMTLVRRAEVIQRTTESWDGVRLTLSTARPTGATAAPELHPELISLFEREEKRKRDAGRAELYDRSLAQDEVAGAIAKSEAPAQSLVEKPVMPREANVTLAGFQALYGIQGRVSVDNTGTGKKVRISSETISTSLSAHVVPKLDLNAYLTAKFTLDGETPLLAGQVNLFRDGVFMGRGVLPMLAPGEEHVLGFGVDDRIKVKRVEVKRKTSETGILTTAQVEDRSWAITLQNLHDRAIPVTVHDQMPYATHEDIAVEMLPGSTRPSERDVDRKRGVLAWRYMLEAAEDKVINFGYRITRPKGKPVLIGSN